MGDSSAADEGNNIEAPRGCDMGCKSQLAEKWSGFTGLRVACAAGHLNCVQELLRQSPQLAERMDANILSPLHIVAARGHLEIAEELLNEKEDLWNMKGPDGRIPLHYASANGKLLVMKLLLNRSSGSVKVTNARMETALHLAMTQNQLTTDELVTHLKKHDMKEVINWQDIDGNTALHLAVAVKNYEVVRFLLDQHARGEVVVHVNTINNDGWTPLDFLQRGAGDRRIRKILIQAGAIYGNRRASSPVLEGESRADIRNALLVVAGLIANATYQSVLQAPHFKTEVDKTYTKGFLAWYASWMTGCFGRDLAYIVFIIGNTFGLLVSVQMIISLTKDLSVKLPMLLSMTLMVQTYYCHTYYLPFTTLEKEFSLTNVELLSVLPLTIPIVLLLIQRWLAEALEVYLGELSLFDHLGDMYHI